MSEGRTASHPLQPGEPVATPATALPATVDLCVVGGGIYGAWTALEARLRGLRVALVERREWASGTSRASSKLVHGGLRYLEHGDVGLVRTALRERGLLLRLAPHRVRPLTFLVPVTRQGRLSRWHLHLGLRAYDWLAGAQAGVPRMAAWSRAHTLSGAPFLDQHSLVAGFTYGDAGTDDAALTHDVVAAAQHAGALCVAETPVVSLLRQEGRVQGIQLADGQRVMARSTVLTAGPWACALAGLRPEHHARFTKGVHIELPPLPLAAPFLVQDTALLLTAPQDGRVFFAIPWKGGTMVGTTDTDFTGDPDTAQVTEADITYLLHALTATCPGLGFSRSDVRAAWCGLRTLAAAHGSASSLSREWSLLHPEPGLWLPIGGKLTTARVDAVRMVDRMMADLPDGG